MQKVFDEKSLQSRLTRNLWKNKAHIITMKQFPLKPLKFLDPWSFSNNCFLVIEAENRDDYERSISISKLFSLDWSTILKSL